MATRPPAYLACHRAARALSQRTCRRATRAGRVRRCNPMTVLGEIGHSNRRVHAFASLVQKKRTLERAGRTDRAVGERARFDGVFAQAVLATHSFDQIAFRVVLCPGLARALQRFLAHANIRGVDVGAEHARCHLRRDVGALLGRQRGGGRHDVCAPRSRTSRQECVVEQTPV